MEATKNEMADGTEFSLQSVRRALVILEMAAQDKVLTIRSVGDKLGLAYSTANRLVSELRSSGYLEPANERGTYRLGLKLFSLGCQVDSVASLNLAAVPVLRQLSTDIGESTNIAMWEAGSVVYVNRVEPPHSLRTVVRLGEEAPLHCSAVGKVTLAFLPYAERLSLINSLTLTSFTSHTIVGRPSLIEELEQIRFLGYAINDEEHYEGVRGVGAPVLTDHGFPIASVSVAGPTSRIDTLALQKLSAMVIEAAHQIAYNRRFHRIDTVIRVNGKGANASADA